MVTFRFVGGNQMVTPLPCGMARDSSAKIEALIGVALEAFGRAGLDGTRVDAIARSAGMNKRLLYHYVGDKTELFDAASRAAVARLLAGEPTRGDGAAWRMLCQASAAGRCPDLGELAGRLAGEPPAVLGRRLLAALLPEIAAVLSGTVGSAQEASAASAPKPRIKLRPQLGMPSGSGR